MSNLIFWFVAIEHSEVPQYILDLEKYLDPSAAYLIGMETARGVHKITKGQHIHVAADMSVETYNRFHDNIHKKKLKLLLKAANGCGKQVGRLKDVRDPGLMSIYTCKDKKIISKNIDQAELKKMIDASFPKTETWEQQIQNYCEEHYTHYDEESKYNIA